MAQMARTKNPELHDQRRQQILLAASTVFSDKGFHLARTEEICEAASLSAGTVFRHFKTKQDMIEAIAEVEVQSFLADVSALASEEGLRWLSQLKGSDMKQLLRTSEFNLGSDSWLELARNERTRTLIVKADRQAKSIMEKAILRGQREGWIKKDVDAKGFAIVLLATLSGLLFDVELAFKLPQDAVARSLAYLMRSVIVARA
jgi:TetR/AcrR family transcriptional regulator, repressor for uid operon